MCSPRRPASRRRPSESLHSPRAERSEAVVVESSARALSSGSRATRCDPCVARASVQRRLRNGGDMVQLCDYDSGAILVPNVETAGSFSLGAMRGLMGRTSIRPGEGLLLRDPLGCIHTFGMRCDIDIVFLSRTLRVLEVAANVPPQRLRWARGGVAQLELGGGQAASIGLISGRRLVVVEQQIDQNRGRVERGSPHAGTDAGSPSHIRRKAACGNARNLPTVPFWPQWEAPHDLDGLPLAVGGFTQRS